MAVKLNLNPSFLSLVSMSKQMQSPLNSNKTRTTSVDMARCYCTGSAICPNHDPPSRSTEQEVSIEEEDMPSLEPLSPREAEIPPEALASLEVTPLRVKKDGRKNKPRKPKTDAKIRPAKEPKGVIARALMTKPPSTDDLEELPVATKDRIEDCWYVLDGDMVYWRLNTIRCHHAYPRFSCKECKGHGGKYPLLPKDAENREVNTWYMYKDEERFWNGRYLLCKHLQYRNMCAECGGSSLCDHGIPRYYCIDCGGDGICHHGKNRADCASCDGVSLCLKHGIKKIYCKECDGRGLCKPHGKPKPACRDCGGSTYCSHGKIKSYCRDCNGSSFCSHELRQEQCHRCFTHPHHFCRECKKIYVHKTGRYYPHCAGCFHKVNPDVVIPTKRLLRQSYINDELEEFLPPDCEVRYDKTVPGGGGARPDWLILRGAYNIIIECDEHAHRKGVYIDEAARLMGIYEDLGSKPLVVIRFNPDQFQGQSCFTFDNRNNISANPVVWAERRDALFRMIVYYLENVPTEGITTEFMFYPHAE